MPLATMIACAIVPVLVIGIMVLLLVIDGGRREQEHERAEAQRLEERRRLLVEALERGISPLHLWVRALPAVERVVALRRPTRVGEVWHVGDLLTPPNGTSYREDARGGGAPIHLGEDGSVQLGDEECSAQALTDQIAALLLPQTSAIVRSMPMDEPAQLLRAVEAARSFMPGMPDVPRIPARWEDTDLDGVRALCAWLPSLGGLIEHTMTLSDCYDVLWEGEGHAADLAAECAAMGIGPPEDWIAVGGGDDFGASFLRDHPDHEPNPWLCFDGRSLMEISFAWNDEPARATPAFATPTELVARSVLLPALDAFERAVRQGPRWSLRPEDLETTKGEA